MVIEGDELDQGTPSGEVEEEIEEKPDPKTYIKRKRFDAVLSKMTSIEQQLQQEREERIRLEERLKQPATAPERYTRGQLREQVAMGNMTQEQADDAWDAQQEQVVTEKVMATVTTGMTQAEKARTVSQGIAQYKTLVPELMTAGSESRQRVVDEFNYLVGIGAPDSKETELAALRAAFGPAEKLEKRAVRSGHEPDQEVGGGSKPPGGGKKTAFDQLPERNRLHYESLISKGMYTGKDDPKLLKEIGRIAPGVFQARAKKYG